MVSAPLRRARSETAHVWAARATRYPRADASRRAVYSGRSSPSSDEPGLQITRLAWAGVVSVQSCSDSLPWEPRPRHQSQRRSPLIPRRSAASSRGRQRGGSGRAGRRLGTLVGSGGAAPGAEGAAQRAPQRPGCARQLRDRLWAPRPGESVVSGRCLRLLLRGMQTHARALSSLLAPSLKSPRASPSLSLPGT